MRQVDLKLARRPSPIHRCLSAPLPPTATSAPPPAAAASAPPPPAASSAPAPPAAASSAPPPSAAAHPLASATISADQAAARTRPCFLLRSRRPHRRGSEPAPAATRTNPCERPPPPEAPPSPPATSAGRSSTPVGAADELPTPMGPPTPIGEALTLDSRLGARNRA